MSYLENVIINIDFHTDFFTRSQRSSFSQKIAISLAVEISVQV